MLSQKDTQNQRLSEITSSDCHYPKAPNGLFSGHRTPQSLRSTSPDRVAEGRDSRSYVDRSIARSGSRALVGIRKNLDRSFLVV
jgi:hypothetical protein